MDSLGRKTKLRNRMVDTSRRPFILRVRILVVILLFSACLGTGNSYAQDEANKQASNYQSYEDGTSSWADSSLKGLSGLSLISKLPQSCTIQGDKASIAQLVQGDLASMKLPNARQNDNKVFETKVMSIDIAFEDNNGSKNERASTLDIKHDPFIGSEWISASLKGVGKKIMQQYHTGPRRSLKGGLSLNQWPKPWTEMSSREFRNNDYIDSLGTLWFIPVFCAGFLFLAWLAFFIARAAFNSCGKRWATELYRETNSLCYVLGFFAIGILCGVACAAAWTGHTRFVHGLDESVTAADGMMDYVSDFSPVITQLFGQVASNALDNLNTFKQLVTTGFDVHLGDVSEIIACLTAAVAPLQQSDAIAAPLVHVSRMPESANVLASELTTLPAIRTSLFPMAHQLALATDNVALSLKLVTSENPASPTDDLSRLPLFSSASFESHVQGWIAEHASLKQSTKNANPSFESDLLAFKDMSSTLLQEAAIPVSQISQTLSNLPDLNALIQSLEPPITQHPFAQLQTQFSLLSSILTSLSAYPGVSNALRSRLGSSPPYAHALSSASGSFVGRVQGSTLKGVGNLLSNNPSVAELYDKIQKFKNFQSDAEQVHDQIKNESVFAAYLRQLTINARKVALSVAELRRGVSSLNNLMTQDSQTYISHLNAAANDLASLMCYPSVFERLEGIQSTLGEVQGLTQNVIQSGGFLSTIVKDPSTVLNKASDAYGALTGVNNDISSSGLNDADLDAVQQRINSLRYGISVLLSPISKESIAERELLMEANDPSTVSLPSMEEVVQDPSKYSFFHRVFDFDGAGVMLDHTPSSSSSSSALLQAASQENASLATILLAFRSLVSEAQSPVFFQVSKRILETGTIVAQADAVAAADADLYSSLSDLETYYPSTLEVEVFSPLADFLSEAQSCSSTVQAASNFLNQIQEATYHAVGLPADISQALDTCLPSLASKFQSLPDLNLLSTRVMDIANKVDSIVTATKGVWNSVTGDLPQSTDGATLVEELNLILPFIAGSQSTPKLFQRILSLALPATPVLSRDLHELGAELDEASAPLPIESGAPYPGPGALVNLGALTTFASSAALSIGSHLKDYADSISSVGLVIAKPDHTPSSGPPPEPATNARGLAAIPVIHQELYVLEQLRSEVPWDKLDELGKMDGVISDGLKFRDSLNNAYATYQRNRNKAARDFDQWNGIRLLAANMFVLFPLILATLAVWAGCKRKHGCTLLISLLWITVAIVLFLFAAAELTIATVFSDQCYEDNVLITTHVQNLKLDAASLTPIFGQAEVSVDPIYFFRNGDTPPAWMDSLANPEGVFDRLNMNSKTIVQTIENIPGIVLATPIKTTLSQIVSHQTVAETLSRSLYTKLDGKATTQLFYDFQNVFCYKSGVGIAISSLMVLVLAILSTLGACCAARAYKRFNVRWIIDDGMVLNPYIAEALGVVPFSLEDSKALAKYEERHNRTKQRRESMRAKMGFTGESGKRPGRAAMFGAATSQVYPEHYEGDEAKDSGSNKLANPAPASFTTLSSPNARNQQIFMSHQNAVNIQGVNQSRNGGDTTPSLVGQPASSRIPVNIHVSRNANSDLILATPPVGLVSQAYTQPPPANLGATAEFERYQQSRRQNPSMTPSGMSPLPTGPNRLPPLRLPPPQE